MSQYSKIIHGHIIDKGKATFFYLWSHGQHYRVFRMWHMHVRLLPLLMHGRTRLACGERVPEVF